MSTPTEHSVLRDGVASIAVVRGPRAILLVLGGAFDEVDAARLTSLVNLSPDDAADVVVDVSGVTFIDGTLVFALAELQADCSTRGGRLRIVGASAAIRRVCRLADLESLLSAPPADAPESAPESAPPVEACAT